MNAINITIGGLIASLFFIFLCISLNAEQYYKELNIHHDVKEIKSVSVKPTIVLRDRSSIPHVKVISPASCKQPIVEDILPNSSEIMVATSYSSGAEAALPRFTRTLIKEENLTLPKHKKEENISIKKIEVLTAVKEPLSEKKSVYLLSDNNVSEKNSSSSYSLVENIQDKISTLLQERQITFKKNSGKLSREGKEVLDKLIILLSNQKSFTIEVQGHTDAGGKAKVNQWISQKRANRVKKYLLKKGLFAENIKAKGFGESQLLLADKPYSEKNRRVEIYIKRRENARIND